MGMASWALAESVGESARLWLVVREPFFAGKQRGHKNWREGEI